jgi:hypothetical protein
MFLICSGGALYVSVCFRQNFSVAEWFNLWKTKKGAHAYKIYSKSKPITYKYCRALIGTVVMLPINNYGMLLLSSACKIFKGHFGTETVQNYIRTGSVKYNLLGKR